MGHSNHERWGTAVKDTTRELADWLADAWRGGVEPKHIALSHLLTAADLLSVVDCGLLSWPYIQVFTPTGERLTYDKAFTARTVQTHRINGFIHVRNTTEAYNEGGTLRFPSIDDWYAPVLGMSTIARETAPFELEVSAFLAAPGSAMIVPSALTHCVVLQTSGSTEWRLDAQSGQGIYRAEPSSVHQLPAGVAREAMAGSEGSLFMAVAQREPDERELDDGIGLLARECIEQHPLSKSHHLMSAEDKAEWVRAELVALFDSTSPDHLTQTALRDA